MDGGRARDTRLICVGSVQEGKSSGQYQRHGRSCPHEPPWLSFLELSLLGPRGQGEGGIPFLRLRHLRVPGICYRRTELCR